MFYTIKSFKKYDVKSLRRNTCAFVIEYVNHMCTPTGLRAPESVNLIASGL